LVHPEFETRHWCEFEDDMQKVHGVWASLNFFIASDGSAFAEMENMTVHATIKVRWIDMCFSP